MANNINVHRGDVVIADLPKGVGSEQNGKRLCLVIQNDKGNQNSPTTIVLPLTSSKKSFYLPTHFFLFKLEYDFLEKDSLVLCEQITTIDKTRIKVVIGALKEADLIMIENSLKVSLGILY